MHLYIAPVLAIIVGLIVFYGSKDKNVTLGGYIFFAGFLLLLWQITASLGKL